jgi:stage III sporulation protein AH
VLIGVAVAVNWNQFAQAGQGDGYANFDQAAGMMGTGDMQTGGQEEDTDEYFATVELNRQRARDESLEVLQSVLDSEATDETVKAQAMEEMSVIAAEIDTEANIEALLVSKGFDHCVAILNGSSINVVVKSEGELQPAQIAQINAVVYEQTGIEPVGIVISHRQ